MLIVPGLITVGVDPFGNVAPTTLLSVLEREAPDKTLQLTTYFSSDKNRGGTFSIYHGDVTTPDLDWNATADSVHFALATLLSAKAGDLRVAKSSSMVCSTGSGVQPNSTGSACTRHSYGSQYTITFPMTSRSYPDISVDGKNLQPLSSAGARVERVNAGLHDATQVLTEGERNIYFLSVGSHIVIDKRSDHRHLRKSEIFKFSTKQQGSVVCEVGGEPEPDLNSPVTASVVCFNNRSIVVADAAAQLMTSFFVVIVFVGGSLMVCRVTFYCPIKQFAPLPPLTPRRLLPPSPAYLCSLLRLIISLRAFLPAYGFVYACHVCHLQDASIFVVSPLEKLITVTKKLASTVNLLSENGSDDSSADVDSENFAVDQMLTKLTSAFGLDKEKGAASNGPQGGDHHNLNITPGVVCCGMAWCCNMVWYAVVWFGIVGMWDRLGGIVWVG